MMAAAWLTPVLLAASGSRADGSFDLLRFMLIVALVVASVLALAQVIRPLLPPVENLPTPEEEDEQTLRRLGLAGEGVRRENPPAVRPSAVIRFPNDRRRPAFDEDERAYRDPVIAARLREVIGTSRGHRRPGVGSAGTAPPRFPTPGPWLVGADAGRRLGHTGPEPASAGDAPARDQELDAMPPSDLDVPSEESPPPILGPGGPGRSPDVIAGTPPTVDDFDRLTTSGQQPRSKVVPFIPRRATTTEADEPPIDASVVAAITSTVRELLFCANVGEYLHGFALYSDRYLFRFMDETGMSVDEFRAAFEVAPARAADDWTRLSSLSDVRRLDDDRVAATVTYLDGDAPGGSERYTFVFGADRGLWLIDDIAQL